MALYKFFLVWYLNAGPIDVATLQHLAQEIGDDWRYLAQHLNIRRARLQAIFRNNSSSSVGGDSHQAVYEMLTTWMKKMPRASNKVNITHRIM